MGVVVRQGLLTSTIAYGGVLLGYIATLLVFPTFLNVDQIGLIRLIQSNGLMLIPMVTIGMPGVWILKYPEIKNDHKQQSSLLTFQLFLVVFLSLSIACLSWVFYERIEVFFESESEGYIKYIWISLVVLLTQGLFEVINSYFRSQLNVSIPGYFKEIHLRLINLLIVFAFGYGWLSFHETVYLIGANYLATTLLFSIVLSFKYRFEFNLDLKGLKVSYLKNIIYYGGYFAVLGIGNSIITNLGFLLTSSYLGLEANGIYTTCLYIGMIIEMPKRAASQIITPLISDYFNSGDYIKLNDLYFKSSINLGIISLLLFMGIVTNINDLFMVVPKGEIFKEGIFIVVIVGVTKVISMFFGASNEIFTYSPFKRFNIYIMVISAVIMIISSMILIPVYGINGAAISMLLTYTISQGIRYYWIYTKLNLTPFRIPHIKLLLIFLLCILATYFTPLPFNPIINILLRSTVSGIIFLSLVYSLKVSVELNQVVKSYLPKNF